MPRKVNFGAVGRDLYLDVPLSNIMVKHRPKGMIADMIFPIAQVNKQSGTIVEFSRADALRIEDDIRAPGTEAKRITRSVSSQPFYCNNYALKDGVTIEDRANADPIYANEMFANRGLYLTDKLLLNWENRVASKVTSGSNVGSYAAVASAWTDATNSDPVADVLTGLDVVNDTIAVRPNRIVFGDLAWRNFRRSEKVRNSIYGSTNAQGYPSIDQIKDLLEVDWIGVGRAFKNTGTEGLAESLNRIWADHVLVFYAPENPSREEPSFGYSLRLAAPGIPNMQVERHPFDSHKKTDDVEVGYFQDERVTGAAYGYLITNVTSST